MSATLSLRQWVKVDHEAVKQQFKKICNLISFQKFSLPPVRLKSKFCWDFTKFWYVQLLSQITNVNHFGVEALFNWICCYLADLVYLRNIWSSLFERFFLQLCFSQICLSNKKRNPHETPPLFFELFPDIFSISNKKGW